MAADWMAAMIDSMIVLVCYEHIICSAFRWIAVTSFTFASPAVLKVFGTASSTPSIPLSLR
jgi:hypothetical protein